MWEDLSKFTESAWESVSESAETYVDAYAKGATQQEINRDPKLLNDAEPKKGTRTDGSTITESQTQRNPNTTSIIAGVNNNVLMAVGVVLVLGFVVIAKGR